MQERDNQLKIQLQLRDEYMDAGLKKKGSEFRGSTQAKR